MATQYDKVERLAVHVFFIGEWSFIVLEIISGSLESGVAIRTTSLSADGTVGRNGWKLTVQ